MRNIEIPDKNLLFKNSVSVDDRQRIYTYLIKIHCLLEDIYLPTSELTLLSYYAAYGVSKATENKFREEHNRTKQAMLNTRYNLSKLGLISREEGLNLLWELPAFLSYNIEDGITFVLNFNKK